MISTPDGRNCRTGPIGRSQISSDHNKLSNNITNPSKPHVKAWAMSCSHWGIPYAPWKRFPRFFVFSSRCSPWSPLQSKLSYSTFQGWIMPLRSLMALKSAFRHEHMAIFSFGIYLITGNTYKYLINPLPSRRQTVCKHYLAPPYVWMSFDSSLSSFQLRGRARKLPFEVQLAYAIAGCFTSESVSSWLE